MTNIESERQMDVLVLIPSGSMVSTGALSLELALQEALSQSRKIVINMHAVSYVDSTCLGALTSGLSKARKLGGYLRLARVPQNVAKVLQLGGLPGDLTPFPSVEAAIQAEIKA